MSWRQEYRIERLPSFGEDAATIDSVLGTPTFDSTSNGTDNFENEQIAIARKLARELALSGACGSAPLKVELSGHANPKYEPQKGWAYDSITINVHHTD